jgi:hypothetical protein
MMPYSSYRNMSGEDAYALVAYLNSLPPVKNSISKPSIDFPVSSMIKIARQPAGSVREPNRADKVKYLEYPHSAVASVATPRQNAASLWKASISRAAACSTSDSRAS